MKIFSANQIRQWDRFTIENEETSSLQLMERAAKSCTSWLINRFGSSAEYCVFCGPGNNGGDGFAVARLLHSEGADVTVYADLQNLPKTEDAQSNLEALQQVSGITLYDLNIFPEVGLDRKVIIIDALFGSGFSGNLRGVYKNAVHKLNSLENMRVSIDLPSGLGADEYSGPDSVVVSADYTLTFQSPKKTFLHPETGVFSGKVVLLDIGLSKEFYEAETSEQFTVDEQLICRSFHRRSSFSNKGNFGKSLIVAGSYGKTGAAVLAVRGALRTGSGITVSAGPSCGYNILQTACPEAMFEAFGTTHLTAFEAGEDTVVGVGPGLGRHPETAAALRDFLHRWRKPLVLDADALNILAENPEFLRLLPAQSIITPHPREFERLFGKTSDSFNRTSLAKQMAAELNICIVLKDHHTQVITSSGEVYYNTSGNAGMAKGGSGDVLLGMITALLAQKYSTEQAAVLAVWIHGKAGDLAAEKKSQEAMLATDLLDEIGNVFLALASEV